jgi:hypothetical protein
MFLETLMRLLSLTIPIILAYYLQLIWEDLMRNELETLEHERATYLERILCLLISKFTPTLLIQILAREIFQKKNNSRLSSYSQSQETNFSRRQNTDVTRTENYSYDAMNNKEWTPVNYKLRYAVH